MNAIPLTQKAVIKLQKMLFQREMQIIKIRKEFVAFCEKMEFFATVDEELNAMIKSALNKYKPTTDEMIMWLFDDEKDLAKWAELKLKYIQQLNEEYRKDYKEDD